MTFLFPKHQNQFLKRKKYFCYIALFFLHVFSDSSFYYFKFLQSIYPQFLYCVTSCYDSDFFNMELRSQISLFTSMSDIDLGFRI